MTTSYGVHLGFSAGESTPILFTGSLCFGIYIAGLLLFIPVSIQLRQLIISY